MRATQLGVLFRVLGLGIGLGAAAALLFRVDASHLSPFWIKIAIYKLAFIAAFVLLTAGGMLGRRAGAKSRSSGTSV
jgi:hypothetical protein